MHRGVWATAAWVLVLAVWTGGCAMRGQPDGSASAGAAPLKGTAWVLTSLRGEPLPPRPADWADRNAPSLEFDAEGKRVSGGAGVNRFFAPVTLATGVVGATGGTGRLEFGNAGSTMMAGPEDLMTLERRYLETLRQVRRFEVKDGRLRLLGGAGEELATFVPAKTP
ncbi:MAG: META domain-containing protein [Tepidisphaerales bacterium]